METLCKCPDCDKMSTFDEWNEMTYQAALEMDPHADYDGLTLLGDATCDNDDAWFVCPKCERQHDAHEIERVLSLPKNNKKATSLLRRVVI